jgi:glycosyltransferase involved in cell wall biosynthesis
MLWITKRLFRFNNVDKRKIILFIVAVCMTANTVFFVWGIIQQPHAKHNKFCKHQHTTHNTSLEMSTYSTSYALSQRKTLREILKFECTRCFKTVLVDGPLGKPSSFGRVSTAIALSLDRMGWDVYLEAWSKVSVADYGGRLLQLWQKRRPFSYDLKIRVSHADSFDTASYVGYNLAVTAWEATHVPQEFNAGADTMDVMFAPSVYNRDLFRYELHTETPIELFSHGIDDTIYSYVERPLNRRPFTFLFVSTNTYRKNPQAVLEAFFSAFPSSEFSSSNVKLIMASTPPYPWGQIQQNFTDPRIVYNYGYRTDEEVRDLYINSDCFVLPTRGEGFGLPVLEALATGLPVITTDFGGVWDFCNPETCFLVRINGVVRAVAPITVAEKYRGMLVEVDKTHLAELMRHVYNNHAEALQKGKVAAEGVKKNWTWEVVISALLPKELLCEEQPI